MGWGALADVFANITGWFSTGRVDKRHRKQALKLKEELSEVLQKSDNHRNRKRIDRILSQLRDIERDLSS